MKTRYVVMLMAAVMVSVLCGAIAIDQVRAKNREVETMRAKLEAEQSKSRSEALIDSAKRGMEESQAAMQSHDRLKATMDEISLMKARLEELRARKPETLEARAQQGLDLADLVERIAAAQKRMELEKKHGGM